MEKIIHLLDIAAPRQTVFGALTSQEGLSRWWTRRVKSDDRVGGLIYFTFVEGFNPDMEIIELTPDAIVKWLCVGGHENWFESTLTFTLRDVMPGTRLIFEQVFKRNQTEEDYGAYNYKWGYFLTSLKRYCESGQGYPYAAEPRRKS